MYHLYAVRPTQVLRLEANVIFARSPEAGARLGSGLRAAIKAGGCRHLHTLSVTLEDFDGTFFLKAPRATDPKKKQNKNKSGAAADGSGRGVSTTPVAPLSTTRRNPTDPMNALAFTRAFHPRASGGGLGAVLHISDTGGPGDGGDGGGGQRGGSGRSRSGFISSLGLPYARLHPRTVEELATYAIPSLTFLDLSFCYIGPAGAAALAHALDGGEGDQGTKGTGARGRGSRSLRSLKLPHNAVGDSGASALSRALRRNRCLTFLSLASNGIGPVGGRALADAVGHGGSASLACLDVGDNPLGEQASALLVAAATAGVVVGDSASELGGGGRGGRDGRGSEGATATVKVQGLHRVAGASVAVMTSAEKGASTAAEGSDDLLVAIPEEVLVQGRDLDGFDQVVSAVAKM
ncbi:MAG: hypothetical protein AAF368_11960 [Planctomycetota bacterium]